MDLKKITKHKFFLPITLFVVFFVIAFLYKYISPTVEENFQSKYDKAIVSWIKIGNEVKSVEFGYDSNTKRDLVLGINDKEKFIYYDNSQIWKTFPNTDLNQICAKNKDLVVGLNREGVLFGSENAFSNEPAWIRFDGREQTNTPKGISLINVGFDGMLVVVVKNKLYGFQIPTEGQKMEAQFKEIYSHNKNIIDVDVKDQDNIYFIDSQFVLQKFSVNKGYQQVGSKGYKKISVGNDGSLWAIDNTRGSLWMYSASNKWEKADKMTYIDVDAKNSDSIVAVTTEHHVRLGSVSGFPKIPTPVETPFQISAYSGGHNGYKSSSQKTDKPSIHLQVEYNDIIPINVKSLPERGLHVVSINEYGQLLSKKVYNFDKNNLATLENQLRLDFNSLVGDKTTVALPNLVKGFFFDKTIRGSSGEFYSVLNKYKHEIEYISSKEYAGYYKANIRSFAKYKVSFDLDTDGEFMIDFTGANEDSLPSESLPTVVDGVKQTKYEKTFTSTVGGEMRLYLKNLSAKSTKIRNFEITELSDTKSDSELIFFMVQTSIYDENMKEAKQGKNRLSQGLLRFFEDFGYAKLRNLQEGSSYISVLDARRKFVIFEESQDNSDVQFNSEGKTPVIDAAFNKDKIGGVMKSTDGSETPTKGDKYLIHKKESILWSISEKKVLKENIDDKIVIPNIPNLPTPFNQRIDAALDLDNTNREVLFFRGNLYIKYNTITEEIVDGPAIIGKGMDFKFINRVNMPKENYKKFLNGIDATVSFNGNAIVFRGNQYAVYNLVDQTINEWGLMTDAKSKFAKTKLPESFKYKIDAAVNRGTTDALSQYYIFSRDKWILMDNSNDSIVTGPHSLVTHPDFSKLPLRFRVNVGDLPPEPFLNHSRFRKNTMSNYDISVSDGGIRGLAGWDKRNIRNSLIKKGDKEEILPAYNMEVIYNYEKPPIIASEYREFLRKELQEASFNQQELNNINNVLKYYHQTGKKSQHQVRRFGGNSVSFSLMPNKEETEKDNGKWVSRNMRTPLNPGCFYTISIYAKTSLKIQEGQFHIRPFLSYTKMEEGKLLTKENHDKFSPIAISEKDGWQKLSWNIQLDTKTIYNDVSFEYYQDSKQKAMHSLYGPYVKPVLGYPDQATMDDLVGNNSQARSNTDYAMIVFENLNKKYLQGRRNANGAFSLSSCVGSSCSQIPGVKFGLEKFKISRKAQTSVDMNLPSKYVLSHGYLTTTRTKGSEKGGAVHVSVDTNENIMLSEKVDESTEFFVLVDLSGNLMFLHIASNKFVGIDDNGVVSAISSKGNPDNLASCKFKPRKLMSLLESFANPTDSEMEHTSYVDAIVPLDYKYSSLVYMFRNDISNEKDVLFYCVYDLENKGWVTSTTPIGNGTKFSKLPSNVISEMKSKNVYWEGENENTVKSISETTPKGTIAKISNKSFKENVDAVVPILQDNRIVYIFNGNYYVIWNLDTDDYADSKTLGLPFPNNKPWILGAASNNPWLSNLPATFSHIDAAFCIDQTRAILISGNNWCIWNLALHDLEDINKDSKRSSNDVSTLSDKWAASLPPKFKKNIDSGIAIKGAKGKFLLFSGDSFKIVTLQRDETGKLLFDAPANVEPAGDDSGYFLGSHNIFKNLPGKFRPTKAELCKAYLKTTQKNSSIPEKICQVKDTAYDWVNMCPYLPDNEKSCVGSGLKWNKDLKFCATETSKDEKYKKTNQVVLDKFQEKYERECKEISKMEEVSMSQEESTKNSAMKDKLDKERALGNKRDITKKKYKVEYEEKTERLSDPRYFEVGHEKNEVIKGLDQMKIRHSKKTNEILQDKFDEFKKSLDNVSYKQQYRYLKGRSCLPIRGCLSEPLNKQKELPTNCNKAMLDRMLGKVDADGNVLNESGEKVKFDVQQLKEVKDLMLSDIDISNYPISKHPNYNDYLENKYVDVCPSMRDRKVTDYKFNEFPESKFYIQKDKMVGVDDVVNASTPVEKQKRLGTSFNFGENQSSKQQEPSVEKLVDKIRNGTLTLRDIVSIVDNKPKIQYLKNFFRNNQNLFKKIDKMVKEAEKFSKYEPFQNKEDDGSNLTYQLQLIDVLQKNSDDNKLLNFVVEYMEKNHSNLNNLMNVKDFKQYNEHVKEALRKYNLDDNKVKKVSAELDKLAQSQEMNLREKVPLDLKEKQELQSLLNSVPEEAHGVVKGMYDIIARMKREKARLKRTCIKSGKQSDETNNKMRQLNDSIKEYQQQIIKLTGNPEKKCKQLGDYKIQNHPDFKKALNNKIPCWGCKI